ncbi:MAG: hypothetical protein AB2A00_07775 [Myxococcota bacterium]
MTPLLLALQVLLASPDGVVTAPVTSTPAAEQKKAEQKPPQPSWSTWFMVRLAHVVDASGWAGGTVAGALAAQFFLGLAASAAAGLVAGEAISRGQSLPALDLGPYGTGVQPNAQGGVAVFFLAFLVAAPWMAHLWDFVGFNVGASVLGVPSRQRQLALVSSLVTGALSLGMSIFAALGAAVMAGIFRNAYGLTSFLPDKITYQAGERPNDFYVASVAGGALQILALTTGIALLAVPLVTGLATFLALRPLAYLAVLAIDERGPTSEPEPHHVP